MHLVRGKEAAVGFDYREVESVLHAGYISRASQLAAVPASSPTHFMSNASGSEGLYDNEEYGQTRPPQTGAGTRPASSGSSGMYDNEEYGQSHRPPPLEEHGTVEGSQRPAAPLPQLELELEPAPYRQPATSGNSSVQVCAFWVMQATDPAPANRSARLTNRWQALCCDA